jgi:hypothetical protein
MKIMKFPRVRWFRPAPRVLVDAPLDVDRIGMFRGEIVIGLVTSTGEWRISLDRTDGLTLALALEAIGIGWRAP